MRHLRKDLPVCQPRTATQHTNLSAYIAILLLNALVEWSNLEYRETTIMTQLKEQFSDHDWSFLVHLPTTVGVWMANQEQGGGPTRCQFAPAPRSKPLC